LKGSEPEWSNPI